MISQSPCVDIRADIADIANSVTNREKVAYLTDIGIIEVMSL